MKNEQMLKGTEAANNDEAQGPAERDAVKDLEETIEVEAERRREEIAKAAAKVGFQPRAVAGGEKRRRPPRGDGEPLLDQEPEAVLEETIEVEAERRLHEIKVPLEDRETSSGN